MENLRQMVKEILNDELKSLLADVTYRIGVLHDEVKRVQGENHKITSGMLNLTTHQIDGFVVTDNTPTAGKIAWSDCNIVYKGTSYAITDGNTEMKYVYWESDATPTTFKFSDTKPVLTDDDVMICVNNEGTHQMVIGIGRMTPGGSIIDGTVDSDEIAKGAVLTDKIASLAITEGLLASGAVTVNKIGSGAVTEIKIGSNAVTDAKIKDGAVVADKIGANAVTEGKIGSNAVTEGKIKSGAVSEVKLADSAVTSGKIAQNAIIADKINSGAITEAKIANNAVTSGKIASGSVAENKLSIAMHLLF